MPVWRLTDHVKHPAKDQAVCPADPYGTSQTAFAGDAPTAIDG